MHALYNFLINVDEDDTLADAVEGQFASYAEHKFDDNNWYEPLILAVKDGKVDFSDTNYRGGVDSWIENRDEWNFYKAHGVALDCMLAEIVSDLNLISAPANQNPFDNPKYSADSFDSADDAAKGIAEALADSYSRDLRGDRSEDWRTYCRPRLAKTYEAITDDYNQAPFFEAWDFTPYTSRNFDLTNGDDYGLAILTVDIHT